MSKTTNLGSVTTASGPLIMNQPSYTVQDITVTTANPWIISGNTPVVVNVNKVTVEPGGQIQVLTDASITIAELVKV